jgi:acetoacetate decarboxylase
MNERKSDMESRGTLLNLDSMQVEVLKSPDGKHSMEMPFRCYDWGGIMATYTARADRVRSLLPSPKLKPALLRPGTALVALTLFEFRDVAGGIEPYREFSVSIPVLYNARVNVPFLPLVFPKLFPAFGPYVHAIPVTTRQTLELGRAMWGWTEFLCEVGFEDKGDSLAGRVDADGQHIVSLEVRKLPTRMKAIDYHAYAAHSGGLNVMNFRTKGQYGFARFKKNVASYTLGDHPLAKELHSLGMGSTPVEVVYAPHLESTVGPVAERLPL